MRIESSIVTSLSELRAIEQQRIAEERAAIDRERATEIEAKRAAAQALVDAEQARLRAEREELMRIEQARLEAEREARLRVEAAEAGERARLAAALEQQRMQEEVELRRAEIAKKRPTWMLVVTGLALVATIGLTVFAVDRSQQREEADRQRILAENETQRAQKDAEEVRKEFDKLVAEMEALDAQVMKAEKVLREAQSAADRKRAAELVAETKRQHWEAQQRKDELARKLREKERGKIIKITEECKNAAIGRKDCI